MLADFTDWVNLFNSHWETYGRKIKLIFYESQGGNDEAGQRADAIEVATQIKPFATFVPLAAGTYVSETAARGIVSISGGSDELFEKRAPFLYGYGTPTSQATALTYATYIGKRLWGRPAKWAGSPDLAAAPRKLGLLYPGDTDKAVLDLFDRELAKYGAKFAEKVGIEGDQQQTAAQYQNGLDKFRSEDINVVVSLIGFAFNLVAPTKYATSQAYFPEWFIKGTVFETRLLDPAQSAHTYGLNALSVPMSDGQAELDRLFHWEYGRLPQGAIVGQLAGHSLFPLFSGIHLAGPDLNPTTFHKAIFETAPSAGGAAQGFVTSSARAWGPAGEIWPWANYSGQGDWVEAWWDPSSSGPDETGREAPGVYRFPNGGKRYFYNQIPSGEPSHFLPQGTVTHFTSPPPNELAPAYPNKRCGSAAEHPEVGTLWGGAPIVVKPDR